MTAWLGVLLVAPVLLCAEVYRRAWRRAFGGDLTATGFGALLALFLLVVEVRLHSWSDLAAAYLVMTVGGAVYWSDDIWGLAPKFRLTLQFTSGVSIGYLLRGNVDGPALVLVCLCAGVLNVFLTNAINFFDGADLNIATPMAMTGTAMLLVGSEAGFSQDGALVVLSFVAAFSLFNAWPRTLYFGDAGCFVFATFVTAMAVRWFVGAGSDVAAYAAIPLAFPICDILYVLMLRVRDNDLDLRSRNTRHLYQRLQEQYGGFWYLVPQFTNVVLLSTAAFAGQFAGLPPIWTVGLAGLVITPALYAMVRWRFVHARNSVILN